MTVKTNSRIAGFTFIFYIAAGIGSMMLFGKAGWWEWMPMLVFELVLAFWLIVKGVGERRTELNIVRIFI